MFLWENMSVYKTAYVTHQLAAQPSRNLFEVVDMPPCIPTINPIEYAICELADELGQRIKRDWKIDLLKWSDRGYCERDQNEWKFPAYI